MINEESLRKTVHRMEAAAQQASNAADRMEAAAQRVVQLLEDGYGGNGLLLLERLNELKVDGLLPVPLK